MSSIFQLRNADIAWRRMGDEGTLIDLVQGRVHSCNATSSVVVDALRNGATLEALVAALVDAFEVDSAVAREGARATIEYLRAEGVLDEVGSDGESAPSAARSTPGEK